jgi:hypothetical protein
MKISELIDKLESIRRRSGDLRVVVYNFSSIEFSVVDADVWEHRLAKKSPRQRQERLFYDGTKQNEGPRCVVIGNDIPF